MGCDTGVMPVQTILNTTSSDCYCWGHIKRSLGQIEKVLFLQESEIVILQKPESESFQLQKFHHEVKDALRSKFIVVIKKNYNALYRAC